MSRKWIEKMFIILQRCEHRGINITKKMNELYGKIIKFY